MKESAHIAYDAFIKSLGLKSEVGVAWAPGWGELPEKNQNAWRAVADALGAREDVGEQVLVQLAGCGVAALGGTSDPQVAKPGDYGWSPAYGDVLKLRLAFEKLAVGRSPDQVLEG